MQNYHRQCRIWPKKYVQSAIFKWIPYYRMAIYMEVCDPGQDNPTFLRNTDRSEELILLLLGSDHLLFNLQGIPEVYIMHFDHPPLALRSICSTANPDPVALLMQFPHWFTNKSMNFPFFISSSPWINQGAIKVIKMIKFYAFLQAI